MLRVGLEIGWQMDRGGHEPKVDCAEYFVTCWHTSVVGNIACCAVFCKCAAVLPQIKVAPRTKPKAFFVLDRKIFCRGFFVFRAETKETNYDTARKTMAGLTRTLKSKNIHITYKTLRRKK